LTTLYKLSFAPKIKISGRDRASPAEPRGPCFLASERRGRAVCLVAKPPAVARTHALRAHLRLPNFHGGGGGGCSPPLFPARRSRSPSTAELLASPQRRHTPDRSYQEHILPRDAWSRWPPIRARRRWTGSRPGKDVPPEALLPPLPAPARPPPARRRQVPRRRLHRGRPRGHLRVTGLEPHPTSQRIAKGAGEELCIDLRLRPRDLVTATCWSS
jgi:hypothetical protein